VANIGSFKRSGTSGEEMDRPARRRATVPAPRQPAYGKHQIDAGRVEIGAAWLRQSDAGRDPLSVKLDDPSFNAPIYANLVNDEDGESYALTWSRSRKTYCD
jgi:uncharacterized protein (DUF736 family)